MTVDGAALSNLWDERWPESPPVAHLLRDAYRDRWVRFHSLPLSKRYAETEAEYEVLLARHNTVITELAPGTSILVITTEYVGDGEVTEFWRTRKRVLPDASKWQTLQAEPSDTESGVESRLFVCVRRWRPGVLDDVLRARADDEIGDVIIAPVDLEWLYCPYDGGADVIAAAPFVRDGLKARHSAWLSPHSHGL